MRRFSIVLAALVCVGAGEAAAQSQTPAGVPPAPGRFTLFLNGAVQSSSQEIARSTQFDLYEEQASIEITQNDIKGGGTIDVGGSVRLMRNLGVGIAYTAVKSSGDGAIAGSIPHPLLFDTFRTLSATESDLEHKEQGVHVFATWRVPVTEKFDVTLSAGPSFFNISQDFIRGIQISETTPFTTVTLDSVELLTLKQNGVGFNAGIDAAYAIARAFGTQLGVGVTARYARGGADFAVTDSETVAIKAGGFQVGGGIRVRF